jgi:putative ABC transport system substrate-binding protein
MAQSVVQLGEGRLRRRAFIMRVAGAALTWPLVAHAQSSGKRWRVGLLEYSRADVERVRLWGVFRQRLRELGYVEGDNVVFEPRWAEGRADRLPALAAELVKLQVDVIATAGTPAAQAAKGATSTIPIVMATGGNPVGVALVASLSRPGGNVTGEMTLTSEILPKLLELLREMIPHASRIAILVDPSNSSGMFGAHEMQLAAQVLGISVQVLSARSAEEFESAFKSILQPPVVALIIVGSAMFFGERLQLADLAMKNGIPTAANARAYAEAGCLISYAADFANTFRRAAEYVEKILKGAKPADLPVEQPTKFELVINLKSAKALGLEVPPILLAQADELIE